MYRSFNGFIDYDFDVSTYISIWPINRIIVDTPKFYKTRIVFADIAMGAEIITIEPSERGSIFNAGTGGMISENLELFWKDFFDEKLSF